MSFQTPGRKVQEIKGTVSDYGNAESAVLSWGIRYDGQVRACGGYDENNSIPRAIARTDDVRVELQGDETQSASYTIAVQEDLNGDREQVEELLETLDPKQEISL